MIHLAFKAIQRFRINNASRAFSVAWLAIAMLSSAGCTICSSSGDLAYPTYGGAWERTIRESGRVGSVFDPAGARASALVSRDQPVTADELERERREEEELLNPSDRPPGSDPSDSLDDGDDADPSIQDADPTPDNPDDVDDPDTGLDRFDDDDDPELKQKMDELRKEELDVKVIPGNPLPPLLR